LHHREKPATIALAIHGTRGHEKVSQTEGPRQDLWTDSQRQLLAVFSSGVPKKRIFFIKKEACSARNF
jgi:hypothetical protein